MSAPIAERLYTAEEFLRMEFEDGVDAELLYGRVVCISWARTGHGRRAARIDRALNAFATLHALGDTTGEGASNLAVEVISPSDREEQVADKVALWLTTGAERVWEVRPRLKTVTVHRRDAEPRTFTADMVLTSDDASFTVPGFELPVTAIFE